MGARPEISWAVDVLPWLSWTVVKGTLILATALLLVAALRRAPGRTRHLLWSLAFIGLLAVPVLTMTLPVLPLELPVPGVLQFLAEADGESAALAATPSKGGRAPRTERPADALIGSPAGTSAPSTIRKDPVAPEETVGAFEETVGAARGVFAAIFFGVWLTGFVFAMAALVMGIVRGARLVRQARATRDTEWLDDLEWHRRFFGVRRPIRLLESAGVHTPMTCGLWRPVVLLPEGAVHWSPERRRLVILHELVHIHRHDVFRHLLSRVGVSLYWLHPLAWAAARSSTMAREQACDEEVIRLGVKPSVYAAHLVAISDSLRARRVPAAALPMIQRSQLERRLMSILDSEIRPPHAVASVAAAAFLVAISIGAGLAIPVPAGQMPEAGQPPASTTPGASGGVEMTAPAAQAGSSCWPGGEMNGNFSGSISRSSRDGITTLDMSGGRGDERVVQRNLDGLRLCMYTSGDVEVDASTGRLGRLGAGGVAIFEAEENGRLQRLEMRGTGASVDSTWTIDGGARQVDAEVELWRDQMAGVLHDYARISALRGERSRLRGEISSIRGQRSSLRGQISSVRGQRSSLRGAISAVRGSRSGLEGRISSARGHVSALEGEISAIRGHVSSLRGQISSHRGAISGLRAGRSGASEEALAAIEQSIREHEEGIAAVERAIQDYDADAKIAAVRAQIDEYDLEGRVAAIRAETAELDVAGRVAELERQIEELDVEGRIAQLERQIEELDVEGKVEEIERQIEELDVDDRVREIESRLEPKLRQLRETIGSIGRLGAPLTPPRSTPAA